MSNAQFVVMLLAIRGYWYLNDFKALQLQAAVNEGL